MSPQNATKETVPTPSFWGTVTEVIKGLRKYPVLLFGYGMAIVVLAAGTLALENLRIIAGVILALLILIMVSWITTKALSLRSTTPKPVPQNFEEGGNVEIGSVEIGPIVTAEDNVIRVGSVDINSEATHHVKVGPIRIGAGSRLKKNKINGGRISIRNRK